MNEFESVDIVERERAGATGRSAQGYDVTMSGAPTISPRLTIGDYRASRSSLSPRRSEEVRSATATDAAHEPSYTRNTRNSLRPVRYY